MNKNDLIERLCKKHGISRKEARQQINNVTDEIILAVIEGEPVKLAGFGTFEQRHRKSRKGVNPQNASKHIPIPEKTVPYFKASKNFKKLVNRTKK